MCRVMSQHTVSTPTNDDGMQAPASSPVIFRKVLLTRCQKEFEKDRSTESALDDLRKKVEDAESAVRALLQFSCFGAFLVFTEDAKQLRKYFWRETAFTKTALV